MPYDPECLTYGHPVVPMPAANRAALAKIAWPALDAYPVEVER